MVTTKKIPVMSLKKFAQLHGLTLLVRERSTPIGDPMRFYARFEDCEVKEGFLLSNSVGNGKTEKEAILDYANNIETKNLVFRAYRADRRDIVVPRFTRRP